MTTIPNLPIPRQTRATILPCLRYRDAPAAIEWLCSTLGFEATLVVRNEDGTVAHAQLSYGNGMIMLGSIFDTDYGRLLKQPVETGKYVTQSSYLVVNDADWVHERVMDAGGEVVLPLQDEDYGGRGFTCRDPEGHAAPDADRVRAVVRVVADHGDVRRWHAGGLRGELSLCSGRRTQPRLCRGGHQLHVGVDRLTVRDAVEHSVGAARTRAGGPGAPRGAADHEDDPRTLEHESQSRKRHESQGRSFSVPLRLCGSCSSLRSQNACPMPNVQRPDRESSGPGARTLP